MRKEYLENPLNRNKNKYKFYLRHLENYIKYLFIYFFILPIIFPRLLFNYQKKNKYLFKDFFNQNAVVYIVSCLNQKKNSVFIFKFFDFHKVLSRFGINYILNNFSLYLGVNNAKKLSFIDKNSDYFFNKDYFYYFDNDVNETNNNLVLPFYLTKNFYIHSNSQNFKSLIRFDKKFKIIFSGSSHKNWYAEHEFKNNNNENFLNRPTILDIIKNNFAEKLLIIDDYNEEKLKNIHNKEILIIETNPEKTKRKKIFSQKKHLELISDSNFFLCMPGSSMPLCYHLIETCLVGSVPILSYNEYLHPKFRKDEALFFFNKNELIDIINFALNIDKKTYLLMQKKIINYYDRYLSSKGVYHQLLQKKLPLEIFVNVDHTSSRLRQKRLDKKFII